MPREQLNVQLYFKPYSGSVSVDEANLARVETPEGFENGKEYPVGTELTFTAINNDDSVFDHWVKVTGSKAVDVFTKSITLSVSNTPVMQDSTSLHSLPTGSCLYALISRLHFSLSFSLFSRLSERASRRYSEEKPKQHRL